MSGIENTGHARAKIDIRIDVDEYCYRAFHNRDRRCQACPVVMRFGERIAP